MTSTLLVHGGQALHGTCCVPGDKSISHRALIFGGIADGPSRMQGFLDGGDCRATIQVMRALGIEIQQASPTDLTVFGKGLLGLKEPVHPIHCGNSGTTIRLMAGLLAGQAFTAILVGTDQIHGRPMARVVEPLREMGAHIIGRQNGKFAPLAIEGQSLRGIRHRMKVASAQVKSSILLASLYAEGTTEIVEPGPARDHTERMLNAMGARIDRIAGSIISHAQSTPLRPLDLTVPGDPSSAAFLLVAAASKDKSELTIRNVCINPTRTGIIEALRMMGTSIIVRNERQAGGEPVADLSVQYQPMSATTFGGDHIVTMIDEVPVLAVAATQARGKTVIEGASELRVKETDRIQTTVEELSKMGAKIEARPDGMVIEGPISLRGARVHSRGDHRLAMALAVAGLLAEGTTQIDGAEVTDDSFPGFVATLRALGAQIESQRRGDAPP